MNDQTPPPDAPQPTTSPDITATTPAEPTPVSHPAFRETILSKSGLNKRTVIYIISLFIIGAVVGLILSNVFTTETNNIIDDLNSHPPFPDQPHLTMDQIILPTFGVVIVCICVLLLIGAIAVYTKIVIKTKSPYVIGLLVFLAPLLVQTIFSVNALRSLFLSAAIPDAYIRIREGIGFGFGGFGGVLVVVSVFEIIGLTMLLYLSAK